MRECVEGLGLICYVVGCTGSQLNAGVRESLLKCSQACLGSGALLVCLG